MTSLYQLSDNGSIGRSENKFGLFKAWFDLLSDCISGLTTSLWQHDIYLRAQLMVYHDELWITETSF